ncbi:hypothetical protein Barb6XT_03105 [Bacteroidales bacterium Barb6XT]|nr:hypothetical protein Barb6XT_03105 [Bacteroidales bacterium Barb6XT]
MKSIKKVLCSKIIIDDKYDFAKLLCENVFSTPRQFNSEKTVEVSHIEEKGDIITGILVSTQKNGIAPAHTPGDEEDYSAIPLKDGQGLAYPSVILYSKSTKVLLWEYNKSSLLEAGMSRFFQESAEYTAILPDTNIFLCPVLKTDAYERVKNLIQANEFEFQIASPTALLRADAKNNGSLGSIATVAGVFNASQSIKLTIKASKKESRGVNIKAILDTVNWLNSGTQIEEGRVKNSIVVKGLKVGDDELTLIEETINVVTDRLLEYFDLEQPVIASSLQVKDRKDGILKVYHTLYTDIKNIIGCV